MRHWLLDKPGRLGAVVGSVVAAAVLLAVVVLAVRVDRLAEAVPTASPTGSATPIPLDTGEGERLVTPDPEPTEGDLTLPDDRFASQTERAFPDAGDPTPIAVEAVNEWMAWDFRGLEDNLLPGVLEEATANPPERGTRVDGVARVTTPGPTQAVVTVPTTKGALLVTCVVVEGEWMIESMGWGAGVVP
jgi:hypothetical protein